MKEWGRPSVTICLPISFWFCLICEIFQYASAPFPPWHTMMKHPIYSLDPLTLYCIGDVCLCKVKGLSYMGVGGLMGILHRDSFVMTQRYAVMTTLRLNYVTLNDVTYLCLVRRCSGPLRAPTSTRTAAAAWLTPTWARRRWSSTPCSSAFSSRRTGRDAWSQSTCKNTNMTHVKNRIPGFSWRVSNKHDAC